VRVIVTRAGIEVRGRTDKAQLPPGLEAAVRARIPHHQELLDYFTEYRGKELPEEWSVTFYGEGYGAGIQRGGIYRPDKAWRCFDLLLGESWWTDDDEMRRVCGELNIPTVAHLQNLEGWEIPEDRGDLEYLMGGGDSVVAFAENHGTLTQAEGIVAKPHHVLLDKHGQRVMWKLTFREFDAIERKVAA
jgi:hypothetical protein